MKIPRSTYRLQFNAGFTFRDALAILDYLANLGVSDIYASPIFQARPGSMHGYDVTDPTGLNPELGSTRDFQALVDAVKERGLGWVQDIVPNHMAFDGENPFLADLLENGSESRFRHFFDIDWDHGYESMRGRLLAPFLGKPYAEVLLDGDIKVQFGEKGFSVHYFSLTFPLRIESYLKILAPGVENLKKRLGDDHPDYIKYVGSLYMIRSLSCQEISSERYDQIRFIKRMLRDLYKGCSAIQELIDRNLEFLNRGGEEGRFDELDALLYMQFFRLSYWKVATEELNYRRFFTINELISLRMEKKEVFDLCHSLILELVQKNVFTGLRVDHIDGLYDPLAYLRRLRDAAGDVYITVEKILARDEQLPTSWPVQGTTGYEYLNFLNGIFCRRENAQEMDHAYSVFTGERTDYAPLIYDKKGIIVERFMTGDVDNLAHLMKKISSRDRGGGDITLYGLKQAIYEVIGRFPVYRSYISADSLTDADREVIAVAVDRAKASYPDLSIELEYLRKFLMLQHEEYMDEEDRENRLHFAMRFRQFTGPLMAKGFEDTVLYVYNRLISLNEVGGEPNAFGVSAGEFHDYNLRRAKRWPHATSATSTHDTKRGEDVRARINVLSEICTEWRENVLAWGDVNAPRKARTDGREIPGRNDEYFLYQTLVGAWPFDPQEAAGKEFRERIRDYILKSIREAKEHTGWTQPDSAYEEGYFSFIDAILSPDGSNPFLEAFLPFQRKVAHYGMMNSLSQLLLKMTSPGTPDFFQGTECWELSLVDPDNRRPVDYEKRMELLETIRQGESDPDFLSGLLSTAPNGLVKMFLMAKGIAARNAFPKLFELGSYLPLQVTGKYAEHVIAFARGDAHAWAVVVVPRFPASLVPEGKWPLGPDVWEDTAIELPSEACNAMWRDVVTKDQRKGDQKIAIGEILEKFPVSLLIAESIERVPAVP